MVQGLEKNLPQARPCCFIENMQDMSEAILSNLISPVFYRLQATKQLS